MACAGSGASPEQAEPRGESGRPDQTRLLTTLRTLVWYQHLQSSRSRVPVGLMNIRIVRVVCFCDICPALVRYGRSSDEARAIGQGVTSSRGRECTGQGRPCCRADAGALGVRRNQSLARRAGP